MIRPKPKTERVEINRGLREHTGCECRTSIVWLTRVIVAGIVAAFAAHSILAQSKKPSLPYVTIDHPQFIAASQATFLSSKDILVGVTDGEIAKAYPAAILAQHGVVQDQMPDGPIAITW